MNIVCTIPTSAEVRAARLKVQARYGLSALSAQLWCSYRVQGSVRAWQNWELDESLASNRAMHPGLWELFKINSRIDK